MKANQEELVTTTSAALSAANTYALESGKEWATPEWRVTLIKLQTNMNVAAGLARALHTIPPSEQGKSVALIRQAAKDASVLLAGAPPSGSTAEASALSHVRLKLSEMLAAAEKAWDDDKKGTNFAIVMVLALSAVAAGVFYSRRNLG